MPRPRGGGRARQGGRLQEKFDELDAYVNDAKRAIELRQDPAGIAPERALVFVTAVQISDFARVARDVGLEVFAEIDLDEDYQFPEGFLLEDDKNVSPTLYATMPTAQVFGRLLELWRSYQRGGSARDGNSPWWTLFEVLAELRPWGPEDRLSAKNRRELENRLPFDDNEEVNVELEIWPSSNKTQRAQWRLETAARIRSLEGRILDRSSIEEEGFIYEAILVGLSAGAVRVMLENPLMPNSLVTLDGLQFIQPQTIAQSIPAESQFTTVAPSGQRDGFQPGAPIRAVLLDGTPIAAHSDLDGGVTIEDVHNLVQFSLVPNRRHATAMASLVLRGDLEADGHAVSDSRLLSIPLLVDAEEGATSPGNRLFVDLVHIALIRAFSGGEPLAPDAFVVNFSIGIQGLHFAGRISALARLLDWWAAEAGVLFVVSSGNVQHELTIVGLTSAAFENSPMEDRKSAVLEATRLARFERSLLSPAEALNVLTVGAVSQDKSPPTGPQPPNTVALHGDEELLPTISSALGLGPFRSIKPDVIACGGRHEVRTLPSGSNTRLRVLENAAYTGLHAASAKGGINSRVRTRGTSCSAALTTRSLIEAAAALTAADGPFPGMELPRRDLALLTRALAVNSASWPDSASEVYEQELKRIGGRAYHSAKEEAIRHYGHGYLDESRMREAPLHGATLVGLGSVRKDGAAIFDMPLPPSLSGDRVHRSMVVTLSWFSPVEPSRARYRLAALEAIAADSDEIANEEREWNLSMKTGPLALALLKRGTVWSRRLVHKTVGVPEFGEDAGIPIRVQCRDASGGGLDRDRDIRFAIAVTLELATETQYDIHEEIREKLLVRLQAGNGSM